VHHACKLLDSVLQSPLSLAAHEQRFPVDMWRAFVPPVRRAALKAAQPQVQLVPNGSHEHVVLTRYKDADGCKRYVAVRIPPNGQPRVIQCTARKRLYRGTVLMCTVQAAPATTPVLRGQARVLLTDAVMVAGVSLEDACSSSALRMLQDMLDAEDLSFPTAQVQVMPVQPWSAVRRPGASFLALLSGAAVWRTVRQVGAPPLLQHIPTQAHGMIVVMLSSPTVDKAGVAMQRPPPLAKCTPHLFLPALGAVRSCVYGVRCALGVLLLDVVCSVPDAGCIPAHVHHSDAGSGTSAAAATPVSHLQASWAQWAQGKDAPNTAFCHVVVQPVLHDPCSAALSRGKHTTSTASIPRVALHVQCGVPWSAAPTSSSVDLLHALARNAASAVPHVHAHSAHLA